MNCALNFSSIYLPRDTFRKEETLTIRDNYLRDFTFLLDLLNFTNFTFRRLSGCTFRFSLLSRVHILFYDSSRKPPGELVETFVGNGKVFPESSTLSLETSNRLRDLEFLFIRRIQRETGRYEQYQTCCATRVPT